MINIKINKNIYRYSAFVLVLVAIVGATFAAFAYKGKVLGTAFSIGSSDMKFLIDLANSTDTANLTDELQGPSFNNISANWTKDYLIKLYNNGTSQVQLASNANYLTANDPDDLRSIIYVEPFEWNDANTNGALDTGELGVSYGRKTIVKWKTEGYALGTLDQGGIKGLLLKFSTDTVSDTKQGKSGIFDFEFDSISQ